MVAGLWECPSCGTLYVDRPDPAEEEIVGRPNCGRAPGGDFELGDE